MPYASRRERRGGVSPGGRLGADQHVSSLVDVKMLVCNLFVYTEPVNATRSDVIKTDVAVGVGSSIV